MTPRDDPPELAGEVDPDSPPPLPAQSEDAVADWDAWRIKAREP